MPRCTPLNEEEDKYQIPYICTTMMAKEKTHTNLFTDLKVCVLIPTYNNGNTIAQVVDDVKKHTGNIIVVNDGSTDGTEKILEKISGIDVIGYAKNVGKGYAIRQGFRRALELGYDYAITIDADGQHFADDLPKFIDTLQEHPDSLIIGSRNIEADGMPGKNTFANKFSNFWFKFETGLSLPDTQSGYRLYPVKFYRNTKFYTKKYEFEIEVLVRSAWRDIPVLPIPVKVYYPPEEERVTHFRPFQDFSRISVLNTILVLITLLYIWPLNLFRYFTRHKFVDIIKDQLRQHNENPAKIASALGFGVFMGIVPIWGFQMLTAVFLAQLLRLNKILVLAASNISIPPVIPFIIYFSYKTGGLVLGTEGTLTRETVMGLKDKILTGHFYETLSELGYNLFQYVAGSLVLGLALGLAVFAVSYFLLALFKKNGTKTVQ